MKMNRCRTGLLLALLLLSACKKDETTETLPSLSGLSINSAVPYSRVGATLVFKADVSAITSSDEDKQPETIGLYWQVNSGTRDTLTRDIKLSNPAYSYTFKEAGTYSVTCYAFAGSDFYGTSAATTFKIIDPETAMKGLSVRTAVSQTGQIWQNRNLSGTQSGRDYEDCEVVSALFGRYYSWEEAQVACPAGWHLPSAEEFDAGFPDKAGALMADAVFMGEHMWAYWPEQPITNAWQFNAIPVGYIDAAGADSAASTFGKYAGWWTSSEEDGQGAYRYIFEQGPKVMQGLGSKTSLLMSVRCVADD